jgi:type VI protein secretion system component Hcp
MRPPRFLSRRLLLLACLAVLLLGGGASAIFKGTVLAHAQSSASGSPSLYVQLNPADPTTRFQVHNLTVQATNPFAGTNQSGPHFAPLTFTKLADKFTTQLLNLVATATVLPRIQITNSAISDPICQCSYVPENLLLSQVKFTEVRQYIINSAGGTAEDVTAVYQGITIHSTPPPPTVLAGVGPGTVVELNGNIHTAFTTQQRSLDLLHDLGPTAFTLSVQVQEDFYVTQFWPSLLLSDYLSAKPLVVLIEASISPGKTVLVEQITLTGPRVVGITMQPVDGDTIIPTNAQVTFGFDRATVSIPPNPPYTWYRL